MAEGPFFYKSHFGRFIFVKIVPTTSSYRDFNVLVQKLGDSIEFKVNISLNASLYISSNSSNKFLDFDSLPECLVTILRNNI